MRVRIKVPLLDSPFTNFSLGLINGTKESMFVPKSTYNLSIFGKLGVNCFDGNYSIVFMCNNDVQEDWIVSAYS